MSDTSVFVIKHCYAADMVIIVCVIVAAIVVAVVLFLFWFVFLFLFLGVGGGVGQQCSDSITLIISDALMNIR